MVKCQMCGPLNYTLCAGVSASVGFAVPLDSHIYVEPKKKELTQRSPRQFFKWNSIDCMHRSQNMLAQYWVVLICKKVFESILWL